MDVGNRSPFTLQVLFKEKGLKEDFFLEQIAADYFKQSPYRKPIIGEIDKLKKHSADNVRDFYSKYYIPGNCFLVVSGNIEKPELEKKIREYFASWKEKGINKRIPAMDGFPSKPSHKKIEKNINSDMIAFVLPDLADSNPDSYPLSLIIKAFAIGKKSRLYTRLFSKEKLVDTVKVHSLSGINNGITKILVYPKKKASLEKIIEIFTEELNLLYEFGLNDTELEKCKKDLIFYYRYSYEYNESLASSLGSEELLSKYENFIQYPDKINNLKTSNVNNVIRKYCKPEFLYTYLIGSAEVDNKRIRKIINQRKIIKTAPVNASNIYTDTLPNGMKIIFQKVSGKPTLGISLSSEVSQLNEEINQLGLNLLTSGLLLYGNEKRNYESKDDY